jgi:hypothetical protein
MTKKLTAAIDFEAYYDAEISVVTMGAWKYARATDIYLVSVACDDGFTFVGSPKDCPWEKLDGCVAIWANAPFDLTLLEWLQESGVVPRIKFSECQDVLDLSKFLGRPGSLAGACQSLLGIEMSKDTRNNMKNKKWAEMSDEFKQEVREYALKDAKLTLQLWIEHGDKWPWFERELSRQTREMGMRGLPVDVERAEGYVKHLKRLIWDSTALIPWAKDEGAKILSPRALAEECRKVGLVPPKSLAQDSEECAAWEDQYGEQYPWIGAMRDFRRANILLKKIETLVSRVRPDGTFPFGLRYFGSSTTGRWSGDSGFSMLNLPRSEMFGVDLRSLFCAPPGYKFIILDFSSLEPRAGNYLVGNWEMLDLMRQPGSDIYESHARASMGYKDPRPLKTYDKEEGTEIRKLAKARCLGELTPILTDQGYFTLTELTKKSGVRVWDGVAWVCYEDIIPTGEQSVSYIHGDYFTDDHLIFTSTGTTKAGEVKTWTTKTRENLLSRNPPGGGWGDIWALAYFVGRTLASEWLRTCEGLLSFMWARNAGRLQQPHDREVDTMRGLWTRGNQNQKVTPGVGENTR